MLYVCSTEKRKEKVPLAHGVPWFVVHPVGRNALGSMVRNMCEQMGVKGKTNHNLRATGSTQLFEANVSEKLLQERTGYQGIDALRMYEWTSVSQQKEVSSVICAPSAKVYQPSMGVQTNSESKQLSKDLGLMDSSNLSRFQNCNNCTIKLCASISNELDCTLYMQLNFL